MKQRRLNVRRAMNRNHLLTAAGLAGLLLAACGAASAPTPTTAPVARATPHATSPATTPTPRAGATPRAAATPAPTSTVAPEAGPRRGGTLRLAQAGDPPGWDAQALPGGGALFRQQASLVFQNLVNIPIRLDKGCQAVAEPELAEGYRWLDDLNLEIKLRPGIRFHDKPPVNGRQVTAADVVYGLSRFMKVQGRATAVGKLVAGIRAVDDRTVVISLNEPFADLSGNSFLASGYGAYVLPKEGGGPQESWADPFKTYVGTGPVMFQNYQGGVKVLYSRNPSYWKPGMPYIDQIDWRIIPDHSTRTAVLQTGQIDALGGYDANMPMVRDLRRTAPQIKALTCPAYGTVVNWWRTDKPPLNDVRVRRALSMALDRESVSRALLGGEGIVVGVAPASIPPYLALSDIPPETRRFVEYRPDEARRLLAEAGYTTERPLAVTLVHTRAHPLFWVQWTETVVSAWEAVGVKVTPKWLEYGAYSRTALAGDYEDVQTAGFVPVDFFFGTTWFWSKSPAGQNRSYVRDPELDKVIEELSRTTNETRQKELARQWQLRILDQAYFVTAPADPWFTIYGPRVRNMGAWTTYTNSASWAEAVWLSR